MNNRLMKKMKKKLTAISRIFPRIMAEISSGVKFFSSLPEFIWTMGFEFFSTTLNGKCLISC
jgi:hypothetical protein